MFIHPADLDKYLLSTYCVLLSLGFSEHIQKTTLAKKHQFCTTFSDLKFSVSVQIVHEGRGRRMNQKGKFMVYLDQHAKDSVAIIESLKVFELKND